LANINIWEKANKCTFEGGEKIRIKAFFEKMGDVTLTSTSSNSYSRDEQATLNEASR
jgi:hypothetical protein